MARFEILNKQEIIKKITLQSITVITMLYGQLQFYTIYQ